MRIGQHARCGLMTLICACAFHGAGASTVEIEIADATPFHVFPAGRAFSFDVTATITAGPMPRGLAYQWRDFRGDPLGPKVPFSAGVAFTVSSPSDAPEVAYYGLAFSSDPPGVTFNSATGTRKEIGFAALPRESATNTIPAAESQFGVVHADLDDPHLSSWVKTLTWNTIRFDAWKAAMSRRRSVGVQELPIVTGDGWTSDDTAPVSDAFLGKLEDRIRQYMAADPSMTYWELGLEENLGRRFSEPFYFDNLKAKAATVRHVANDINPNARLLFQIAGRKANDARDFLASNAAAEFDILAPHPYAWPFFPTPEKWLAGFIDDLRSVMRRYGDDYPLWMTEFGAPQNDARVAMMFSGAKPVRGLRRSDHAAYLVKSHVIALERGVEKIFWYNYRDRGTGRHDPEDHFGLVDYWGFPKPSYAAYATMVDCLEGKDFLARRGAAGGIRIYEFGDAVERCFVMWTYPASTRTIPVSVIEPGLDKGSVLSLTNTVGTPLVLSTEVIVDAFPVFLKAAVNVERDSVP